MGLGHTPFLKDLSKELARMDCWQTALDHTSLHSMVVNDFYIQGIALGESKTHSALIVDSDTPLALAIAFERLQPIRGWGLEILDLSCSVELGKAHRRSVLAFSGGAQPRPSATPC
jgi:hypothetical protein